MSFFIARMSDFQKYKNKHNHAECPQALRKNAPAIPIAVWIIYFIVIYLSLSYAYNLATPNAYKRLKMIASVIF